MGTLAYPRRELIKSIGIAANAVVIHEHLPEPVSGSDTPPAGIIPERIARGLAAVAVLGEERRFDGNTSAVASEYDVSRFRMLRLRQWLRNTDASGFSSFEDQGNEHFATREEGINWTISNQGKNVVLQFAFIHDGVLQQAEISPEEGLTIDANGALQGATPNEIEGEEEVEDEVSIHDFVMSENHMYDADEDVYTYYSRKLKRMMKFPGQIIRNMRTDYSNDGGGLTINALSRMYGIPRSYIIELKTLFGWTKDQSIYTQEEIVEQDEKQEEFRAVEALEKKAMMRFDKTKDRLLATKARKWDDLVNGTINPFMEAMASLPPVTADVSRLSATAPSILRAGRKAAVVTPFDLHYGKRGWSFHKDEAGYSMQECEDLVLDKSAELIAALRNYDLEKIIIPVGHDFFHVANDMNMTTNGTPQDMDGNFMQMVVGGSRLLVKMVELYRQVCPIHLEWVPGNHDRESSMAALLYAAGQYANTPDVDVNMSHLSCRSYITWGSNLIGNVHGDGIKKTELPRLMASEVRQAWGDALNTMWFVGHFHFESMTDIFGTQIFQASSLSGDDRWHQRKGYVGSVRSLDAYVLHETAGKIHQDSIPVIESPASSLLYAA